MPSKKKNSKTPSKLSNNSDSKSDSLSSSSVFSASISSLPFNQNREEDISSILDEASARFPSLISKTAFVGRVAEDAVSSSRGCKIWLSESAMVASSISPGSLVSVSLASLGRVSNSFPLSELSDECARYFGLDLAEKLEDEVGNFFALATIFPSCKVLKNEVRLSTDLSYTLGCPASGRIIFVYPLDYHVLTKNANGKPGGSLESCKEVYLSVLYSKGKFDMDSAISSDLELSKTVTNGQVDTTEISSPKTPSILESKISSPHSPQSYRSKYDKSSPKTTHESGVSFDILDVEEVLGNDSSRKLLESCTVFWLRSRILLAGNFVIVPILSRLCIFWVSGSKRLPQNCGISLNKRHNFPAQAPEMTIYAIDSETKVHMLLQGDPMTETSVRSYVSHQELGDGYTADGIRVRSSKLGGLSKESATLEDIINSSPVKGTVMRLGLRPTKGVLLHGPPGTGKTSLARLCARDAGVNLFPINGPEIISQYHGESEQALQEVFDKAIKSTPAVVFIDELDAIAPARKDGIDELSQRMVATLLNLMDGISRGDGVLVIAATNRLDSIEPALRRPGRFDREIEIGVPSPAQRHEILLAILSDMEHSLFEKDVQHLALTTHGFVGADLASLCHEAALICLRRYVKLNSRHDDADFKLSTVAFDSVPEPSTQSHDVCSGSTTDASHSRDSLQTDLDTACSHPSETQDSANIVHRHGVDEMSHQRGTLRITSDDFEKARVRVRPSAMREVILEIPKVSWEDVGGQIEVKMQLMEAVEWPQKHTDAFKRIGTRPPTGTLLFGPPGCSKTLLARAVASEARLNFLAVKGPELFSKWVGESEKAVRSLFAKARANAPSIIFFDEIDGLAIVRGKESDGVSVGDRVMSQLLVEMDGLQERGSVTVIAATNRPDKIDPALLRPGRFDRLLYVGPPNKKDREDIFRVHLRRMPCSSDISINELSLLTEGCTGADISLICREAAIAAMDESLSASEITMQHLKYGIQQVQPSDVHSYETLSSKFQRLVHSTSNEDNLEHKPSPFKENQPSVWTTIRSAMRSSFQILGLHMQPDSS